MCKRDILVNKKLYNLISIIGMKHSHSCQSMPVGPKLSDSCSQESPQLHSDTSKAIETGIVLLIEETFMCFEKKGS